MASSYGQAQAAVADLVERFARNLQAYRRSEYKEAEVRNEFIEPFFDALGWDVYNRAGYAEQYKDVVHEESLRVAAGIEAPDYTFRVGGLRKFFVEAKKPAVNLKADAGPAYQLRRYAWSAKLPLSLLTDFEEFAVYDCTRRPKHTDKAGVGRVAFYTFDQYAERLQDIWDIFAKESVLRGSFDRYAQDARKKRGTSAVDGEFLKEIESWRLALARNLALRNPDLSVHDLNYAVQATIDRIIFLRVAEDRGTEQYGRLLALRNGANVYQRLTELYRQADQKYNAGLFDFRADTLTPQLRLDDKVLKGMVADLYYPQSPYEFSVLGADILGQVYEQFLGKVIRLTKGHRAVVEEKPQVKKAGGVYYTPTYIVEYIVKHTVGELIKGKTPRQIRKLRVLDPACGSGSFLLGAYQYLLDYHLTWYAEHDPEKWASRRQPPIYQGPKGEWRLTTVQKKRILLNNIYGVDIDRQAVGVTKLSLLLKVLEGESQETLVQQLRFWQERALPDLGHNIKCGNSLIGPDYWEGKQAAMFDEQEVRRVNAFDWEAEFAEILGAGGFDAVIGNPPWVSAWTGQNQLRRHLTQRMPALKGHWDLYLAFLLRTLSLLNAKGKHSFVYPTSILTEVYAKHVRERLIKRGILSRVAVFGTERVFGKVSRKVCIVVLALGTRRDQIHIDHWQTGQIAGTSTIDPALWLSSTNCLFNVEASERDWTLKRQVDAQSARVGNIYYVNYGAQISSKVKGAFSKDKLLGRSPVGNAKRCLLGSAVKRYRLDWDGHYLDYQPAIMYGPRAPQFFESPKIIVSKTSSEGYGLLATFDTDSYYCGQRLICLVRYGFVEGTNLQLRFKDYQRISSQESDLYFTGLLNSRLMSHHFRTFVATKNLQGRYSDVLPRMVRDLPIRMIDFSDPADAARHDRLVALVGRMLELHKRQAAARTPADRELYARQIEATDREIDRLVYGLYGLTEEEIGIVEGAVNG